MSNYGNRHRGRSSHHDQPHRFPSAQFYPQEPFPFPPRFYPPVTHQPPGWPIPNFNVPPPAELHGTVHSIAPPLHTPVDEPPASGDSVQEKLLAWISNHNLDKVNQEKSDKRTINKEKPTLLATKMMVSKLNMLNLKLSQWPEEHAVDSHSTQSSEKQALMQEMENLLAVLEDERTKEMVRVKVVAARNRKARRQKQSQKWREKTRSRQDVIEKRHKEIDTWLEGIQDLKMMEQMRKAADESMADVRQKIADVNKQKELILSLTKLRSIRLKALSTSHGGSDDGSSSRFSKKASELLNLLENRLAIYKKEENTLKVLSEAEYEEKRSKEVRIEAVRMQRKHDKLEKQKEMWLFGNQEVPEEIKAFYDYYTQSDSNLESFISIRHQWDSYTVAGHVLDGRIPRGWVVPSEPSSTLWQQYLDIDDKTPSSTS